MTAAEQEHPFLTVLYERGALERPERGPIRSVPDLPTAEAGDPRAARYAKAALEGECREIAAAPEGVRNHTLNRAAFKIGQLVAVGHLDAGDTYDRLAAAAQKCGLPDDEIRQTVVRAVRDGAKTPRIVRLDPNRSGELPDTSFDPFTTGDDVDLFDPPGAVDDDGDPIEDGPGRRGRHTAQQMNGAEFIFGVEADEPGIWGSGHKVLWSPGEALMVTGPPGVGKTTIAQQLVLARIGLTDTFLGFPVAQTTSKVLYLAMDRPRQIARSMRRMVDEGDRELLAERLMVWRGPLPHDVADNPDILLKAAEKFGADTLIVDSVKDASLGLADTERAGLYNRARQRALTGGIEIVEIAHQVKRGGNGTAPKTLQDVHGGMELTAGAGSVFLVWGAAGDLVVEFNHLKQPAEMVGPLHLVHDHDAGRTEVEQMPDVVDVLRAEPWKVWSASDLAARLSESSAKPSRSDVERARKRVEKLVVDGFAVRVQGDVGRGGKPEVRYRFGQMAPDTTWDGR